MIGAAGFDVGKFGQSFDFDGGYAESTPLGLTSGTVEFWVNPDRDCCDLRLFSQTTGPTTLGGATSIAFNNQTAASFVWNGSSWIRLTPGNPVLAGIWTHLAFVYQNNQAALYVNGVFSAIGPSRFDFLTSPLGIGARFLNAHGFNFPGRIDEFSVYDRVLTAAEIASLANAALGPKCITPPDTTPPVVTVPTAIVAEAASAAGAYVTFSASADDAVDGSVAASCIPASGAAFALGVTTVSCHAEDAAGNIGTSSFEVTVVDTTPPSFIEVPADATVEASSPSGAELIINAAAHDAVSGYLAAVCSPGPQYALGTTGVTCVAADAAGNSISAAFIVTVVDTTPPSLVLDDVHVIATAPAGVSVDFTAAAHDLVDGDVEVACSPTSGTVFPIGTTPVTCTAVDLAGNGVSTSFDVIVADGVAPVIATPGDVFAEATSAQGAVVTFAVTASDNIDEFVTPVCSPLAGSQFPLGPTSVRCDAADLSGNPASASFIVTVRDTTAPRLPLRDVVATLSSGTMTVVTFEIFAFDIVDGPIAAECTPSSGSLFPIGTTPVSCRAIDNAGNAVESGFAVRVNDGAAPIVTVPTDLEVEATSPLGAPVIFVATASDNADANVPVTCTPESGSVFGLGTTQVTCEATDSARNVGSASFRIMVVDTTPPVLTIPAAVSASAESPAGTLVEFATSALDLVDGVRSVTCTPASGTTFLPGDTTVECATSDSRGNTARRTFVVTVTVVENRIGRFVAFGAEQVWLRSKAVVLSGDVGANQPMAGPSGSRELDDDGERDGTVEVRIGEHVQMRQPGSRVIGDTVWLRANASVYDILANELINRRATMLGGSSSPVTLPYLTMPAFPVVTAGTAPITVAERATVTLPAGRYGRVRVRKGATLIVTGGTYELLSLDLDQQATVMVRAATEIRIATELDTESKSKIILDQSVAGLNAAQVLIYVAGGDAECAHDGTGPDGDNGGKTVVHIGVENVVQANIYAPNGSVWLKARTLATGAFIGRRVRIGEKVELSLANGLR